MLRCAEDEVDEDWVEGGEKAKDWRNGSEQGIGHTCRNSRTSAVYNKNIIITAALGQKQESRCSRVM